MDTPTQKPGWIFSGGYDFLFFFLPPLILLPIPFVQSLLFPGPYLPLWLMLVAFIHEGMMWGLYSDPQRATIHRMRWGRFFAGPLAILAVFATAHQYGNPAWQLASTAFVWWNFHHLIRQNVGIYILYRHRNQLGHAPWTERWAIYLVNWGCVVSQYYADAFPRLSGVSPSYIQHLAAGMIACGLLFAAIAAVKNSSRRVGTAGAFFIISLFYYAPFLYLHTHLMTAFAASLLVHYIQYIGLLFGIEYNKFWNNERKSAKHMALYLVLAVISWPLVRYLLQFEPQWTGLHSQAAVVIFTSWAGASHYFLDRHIWRMSMADIRASTTPYLRPLR